MDVDVEFITNILFVTLYKLCILRIILITVIHDVLQT